MVGIKPQVWQRSSQKYDCIRREGSAFCFGWIAEKKPRISVFETWSQRWKFEAFEGSMMKKSCWTRQFKNVKWACSQMNKTFSMVERCLRGFFHSLSRTLLKASWTCIITLRFKANNTFWKQALINRLVSKQPKERENGRNLMQNFGPSIENFSLNFLDSRPFRNFLGSRCLSKAKLNTWKNKSSHHDDDEREIFFFRERNGGILFCQISDSSSSILSHLTLSLRIGRPK